VGIVGATFVWAEGAMYISFEQKFKEE